MRPRARAALVTAALAATPAAGCDLALALAVDVSGSVAGHEYRQQLDGLAAALGDPDIGRALIEGRSAVMLIQWTGASRQAVVVPWTRVTGPEALAALQGAVAGSERRWDGYSTAIGSALRFAASRFGEVPDCARHVIDISGDGSSNQGLPPERVGPALVARGVTVNALAITGSEPFLARYFEARVIAGPGAFVIAARGYSDYPRAIRRKLAREVVPPYAAAPVLRAAR